MPAKERSYYGKFFREITVMHGLQTTPQEREWTLTVPQADVKPHQVVLYLGCNVLKTAHLVQTVVDIFKLLDVDFVAVGGAAYCCGIQHFQRGDTNSGLSMAATTVANFKKFQPEQVVMWCPSCIYFYDEVMDMREDFFFQHTAEFLVEKLDQLEFKYPVEANVALHYHTGRATSDAEAVAAQKLLSKIPGINLVDLGTDVRFGRHCNDGARQKVGEENWNAMLADYLQRAVDAGVDTFSPLYHGCHRMFCGYENQYPLKVEHYLTLVGRALGIEHEDRYKKYVLSGDVDAIMADTSPCAVASGVSPEEARAVIQKSFG